MMLLHVFYATDGLLILGVALVGATVFSAVRGLHTRSVTTINELDESGSYHAGHALVTPSSHSTNHPIGRRSRPAA